MFIGTMVIELREFKKKKKKKKKKNNHGQNVKTIFSSNSKRKWYFNEILYTQFCFDVFYAGKSSEVETESKN